MEERQGESRRKPRVVVFDADRTMGESFAGFASTAGMETTVVSSFADARNQFRDGPVDCFVATAHSLRADADTLGEFSELAPDCPLVVVTRTEPAALDDDLVDAATTIVEQTDDSDRWGFLVEKIRSTFRSNDAVDDDPEIYRLLVENARDGLYRLDANGDVVYANESFAEMLGYDQSDIIGSHASGAMADGELERGQRIIQDLMAADERTSETIDLEMHTQDGDQVVVEVNFVVLTEDGTYDGVMGIARDVTERRERERKLQRQNERLEEFASVVSHDLRNPLNVAKGRLELARERVDDENLDRVADAHDQMEALIAELLSLARQGEQSSPEEVLDLASTVAASWQNVVTRDATLRTETSLSIRADPVRLSQLLENLFRNAVEHGGGNVEVTVGTLDDEAGLLRGGRRRRDSDGRPGGVRDWLLD